MNRKALPRLLALFLVAALAVTHLNAQQNIPSHLLNKYNSDELFLDDNEVDVSGTWKGIEVQYDWSGSVITTEYEYTLELQQDGNRVTGQSLIYDKMNDWWATMTLVDLF